MLAGINNAQVIRAGTKNNNGVDTITLPSWFSFKDFQRTKVYVSGDSWIGFEGSSKPSISINKRDSASYYVYYEEGTIWYEINFIKIRWSGFTSSSSTALETKLTYDVIFFSTGEIYIEIIDIPSQYVDGECILYGLENYAFEFGEGKTSISFYPTDVSTGEYEQPRYEVVSIKKPFDERYLIKKDGVLYTIENEMLVELSEQNVNSELFLARGFLDIPDEGFLTQLQKFSILYWSSAGSDEKPYEGRLSSEIKAVPEKQEVVSNRIDMTHSSILGIKSVTADCEGDLYVSVSIDEKQTWIVWNGTTWIEKEESNLGMSKDVFNALTEGSLEMLYSQSKYAYLKIVLLVPEQSVTNLTINYKNNEEEMIDE